MENQELLLKRNGIKINHKNIIIKNGHAVFRHKDLEFSGKSIYALLAFVNTLEEKYKNTKIPIIIDLGEVRFTDKLTYIFLEIICYILITEYKHKVRVSFRCKHNIFIEGIASSPLLLLNDESKENMQKFVRKFSDDLYKNHYRKVMHKTEDKSELSKKMDEIAYFLKFSGVENKSVDELSEVVIELIGNAWEHTKAECLIDLDVTNSYFKRATDDPFLGINIAILNFSEQLLGDAVKNKITNNKEGLSEKYLQVREAYGIHKNFFDDTYKEEDFFNIASFQHKISGSIKKNTTGGTGLTKLVSSLEKQSDAHKCYLITGNRALWFFHQYLEYNQDGWIGFNTENDFLNKTPAYTVIGPNSIYLPGTAYNLNFVMKRRTEKWIM